MVITIGVVRTLCWPAAWYGGRLRDGQPLDNATCNYFRTREEAEVAAERARETKLNQEIKMKRQSDEQFIGEIEEAKNNSKLPKWVISALSELAYEYGHSAGATEIANYELGMLEVFERHQAKAGETR